MNNSNYKPYNKYVFKANEYITLKLEHNQTYIYVKGRRFLQCIRLVLNIQKNNIPDYNEIDSIDEAAEVYKQTLWQNRIVEGPMARPSRFQNETITAEQEFWGHCSNIQAWIENDYDTRILYRNMAFPLLKELMLVGDPKAKKVFKEEIAYRLESGYPNVVNYLLNEGYLSYLDKEELTTIFENSNLIESTLKNRNLFYSLRPFLDKVPNLIRKYILKILTDDQNSNINLRDLFSKGCLNYLNTEDWNRIIDNPKNVKYIIEYDYLFEYLIRGKLKVLKKIVLICAIEFKSRIKQIISTVKNISQDNLSKVLTSILQDFENNLLNPDLSEFIALYFEDLFLMNLDEKNVIKLLENSNSILHKYFIRYEQQVFRINNSNILNLRGRNITDLTKLRNLNKHLEIRKMILDNNFISEIKGIELLINLEVLSLKNNQISEIKGLETFNKLRSLKLQFNEITKIKGLGKLKNLEKLNLSHNKILDINGLKQFSNLKSLNLSYNKITVINYSKLPNIRKIDLQHNPIIKVIQEKNNKNVSAIRAISFPIKMHHDKKLVSELVNNEIYLYLGKELCFYINLDKSNISVHECYGSSQNNMNFHTSYILQSLSSKSSNDKYPGLGTIEIVKDRDTSTIIVNKLHPFVFDKEHVEDMNNILRFMHFCLNLKMWVKYDYDTRLLDNKISVPLLQKIRNKIDHQIQTNHTNKKIITLKNINVDASYLNDFDIYDDDNKFGIV
ncbi:MAG: leucine-rich repeat domain-containing protein [Promethearchaeota archaeon]